MALGIRGEKRVLEGLPGSSWAIQDYRAWASKGKRTLSGTFLKRFPHRKRKVEERHWLHAQTWLSKELLKKHYPGALVCGEHHPNFESYVAWLKQLLPLQTLQGTVCHSVKSYLAPALKANMTRGRSFPYQTTLSLETRGSATRYPLIFLPLFFFDDFDSVKETVVAHLKHASPHCLVVLHLKTRAALSTVAWAVWLISWLSRDYGFEVSKSFEASDHGAELMDFSGIITLGLLR